MKKLIMTIAIVLGMGMASFAQEEVTFEERGLFGKGVDEAAVAHHVMAFDDVVQGGLQFVAGLAVGVVIVAAGDLGH